MEKILNNLMDEARAAGADFSDARCNEGASTAIEIQDGRTEKVHSSKGQGIGVRVLSGGAWGFSTTHEMTENGARTCLREALEMARTAAPYVSDKAMVAKVEPVVDTVPLKAVRRPDETPVSEKVKAVFALEKAARDYDDKVSNTRLNFADGVTTLWVANTFGTCIKMETARTRVSVSVVASDGDLRQSGYKSIGRRDGFELVENMKPEDISLRAAKRAVSLLSAKPCPSGRFPVIFDHSVTGLFVHEAFGHNSEADLVWSGESIISDKMGKKVASDLVNIVDDCSMDGAWGSYPYDSEGVPAQRRVLVENGVVKSFLHSLETAARFGAKPNGAGRSDGASSRPIVRMSNTFIEAGKSKIEDMISDIDYGVLLKGALSGYVSTETGQFTCCTAEGWLIRNGELCEMLRDVAVNGMVLEALEDIDAVSDSFRLSMPGICGKSGQGVPVENGGPHIRLKKLTVGGQEA